MIIVTGACVASNLPCKAYPNDPEGTNSPTGIGRATAHQFAHNGARAIYMCDSMSTHLETHKRELASLYPAVEVHVRQFNAADERALKAVVDDAVKTYGRLDIMFANAGIVGQSKLFTETDSDDFMHTMRTNVLRSALLSLDHATPCAGC